MSQIILDPIHGTTELDGWAEELLRIPEIASERRRLERMKNLGLIYIQFPSATHSKWEHHLGMFHLSGQLNLSKEEKRKLGILCLIGGIGHLPFTFATEDAVLLAAKRSPTLKRSVEEMLGEVRELCEPVCSQEFRDRFPTLMDTMGAQEIHAWLTAWKLKRLPRGVDLGDRTRLVYDRVNNRATCNELYRFLSRLDYVQRDLYYTGIAKFSLASEGFLRRYNASVQELSATPEGSLLEQLKSYLADSLYFEIRSMSREAIYKKRLASKLADGELTLEKLLSANDAELESEIERVDRIWWAELPHQEFTRICSAKIPQGRRFFLGRRKGPKTGDIESQILSRHQITPKFLLEYPKTQKFVVVARRSSDSLEGRQFAHVTLSAVGEPTRSRPIIDAVWNLTQKYPSAAGRWLNERQVLIQDLLSFALRASVRADYHDLASVFVLGFRTLSKEARNNLIRRFRKEFDEFFAFDENMDAPDFWEDLARKPELAGFLCKEEKLVSEILKAAVHSGKIDFALVVEALIWVREWQKLQSVVKKWVIPNVKIEGKNGINQVDAVSVFVRGSRTVIRFHECSKSDSEGKAFDDLQKLEKIKTGARPFDDLIIEQLVYGASGVREHFTPLQPLLDKFGLRERKLTVLEKR